MAGEATNFSPSSPPSTHASPQLISRTTAATTTMVPCDSSGGGCGGGGGDGLIRMKLTSTGPTIPTQGNTLHQPSSMDLAVKFHYLRLLYFFTATRHGCSPSIPDVKQATHEWLNLFPFLCGRFRRSPNSLPFIVCNDSGVRFIEAKCSMTIADWLHTRGGEEEEEDGVNDGYSFHGMNKNLCPSKNIGPDISFSPPLLIQVTSFSCGGISIGLNWALVLGDPLLASTLINCLGHFLASPSTISNHPKPPMKVGNSKKNVVGPSKNDPLSLRKVGKDSDCWMKPTDCQMETLVFHVKESQLKELHQRIHGSCSHTGKYFGSLCALIWQQVGKVREDGGARRVTVCRYSSGEVMNGQMVGVVTAEKEVERCELAELESLVLGSVEKDEVGEIEGSVEEGNGEWDFILYGHNLTFVDMEGVELYGFEVREEKAARVACGIDGIGKNGVVLVFPAPAGEGRIVRVDVPVNEATQIQGQVEAYWRGGINV